jgi:hypothetical protein
LLRTITELFFCCNNCGSFRANFLLRNPYVYWRCDELF